MRITNKQLQVIAERTAGYAKDYFEIEPYATGQINLQVYSVVYTIDPDGFYTARREEDGSVIYQRDPYLTRKGVS